MKKSVTTSIWFSSRKKAAIQSWKEEMSFRIYHLSKQTVQEEMSFRIYLSNQQYIPIIW